ncbi:hypothetical protein [Phyllobacterium phragmitis]|uniref:hypothetical protein n=1 Tax=Phyllobacterium phragmitis TaxID=2670329 RepID=UPI0011B2455C|nr:hypothetical protein [Phyllobacterium phragmitis]
MAETLFAAVATAYNGGMKTVHDHSLRKYSLAALTAFLAAGATGLAFAGWLNHGEGIFQSMIQTGLSWCF